MEVNFNNLPEAVNLLLLKVENLECLLAVKEKQAIMPTDEPLMSVIETAEFLNLSVPTIYGLVQRSEIPVNKKGKRLYFLKSELTAWVKSGRKMTQSEIESTADQYLKTRKKTN